MNEKSKYEALSRSPKCSARRVAKCLSSGISLSEIFRLYADPKGCATTEEFLTPSCEHYPSDLNQLADPPLTLFHQSQSAMRNFPTRMVAIVGSRRATSFGRSWARRLGRALASAGISVCSGLARGIDGAAHRGALEGLERTGQSAPPVAVLGHGLGHLHPPEHRDLAESVAQKGYLLTEYPPSFPPSKWTFPARNRLIAALSEHLVVVEASAKSGSLYTADFALDLGRTVWVVPKTPEHPNSEGVLALLKDGAHPLSSIADFVDHVATERPRDLVTPKVPEGFREILTAVAWAQAETGALNLEDWDSWEVASKLAELELSGHIVRSVTGRWELRDWELGAQLLEP